MKVTMSPPLFLICLLVVALGSCPSRAATWYVDNEAKGGNRGTSWDDAWRSFAEIRWGRDGVSPGDTVFISGGISSKTYPEQLAPNAGGTADAPITIRPGDAPGHGGEVIITATNRFGGIFLKSAANVCIDGNVTGACHIVVRKCADGGVTLAGDTFGILLKHLEVDDNGDQKNRHGISINVKEYKMPIVEISRCRIHNNFQDQINATKPAGQAPGFGFIRVHDCEIYNLADDGFQTGVGGVDFYNNRVYGRRTGGGPGHPDGIQFMGDRYRVYGNTFFNLAAPGLIANSFIFIDFFTLPEMGPRRMADVQVFNNLVYEEGGGAKDLLRGIAVKIEDKSTTALSGLLIANNTVIGMPGWAMTLAFGGLPPTALDSLVIENNVFHDCARNPECRTAILLGLNTDLFTVGSHGNAVNLVFDYNCVSPGRHGSSDVAMKRAIADKGWAFRSGCQANGFMAEPALDAQFRPLNRHSPLIDAGADLSRFFSADIEGTPRPQGKAWDVGAFEYKAAGNE